MLDQLIKVRNSLFQYSIDIPFKDFSFFTPKFTSVRYKQCNSKDFNQASFRWKTQEPKYCCTRNVCNSWGSLKMVRLTPLSQDSHSKSNNILQMRRADESKALKGDEQEWYA